MKVTNRNRWTATTATVGIALLIVAVIIEQTQGQQWLDPFTICITFGGYLSLRALSRYLP